MCKVKEQMGKKRCNEEVMTDENSIRFDVGDLMMQEENFETQV